MTLLFSFLITNLYIRDYDSERNCIRFTFILKLVKLTTPSPKRTEKLNVIVPRFSSLVFWLSRRGELAERVFRDPLSSSDLLALLRPKSSMPVGDDQRGLRSGGVSRGSPDMLRFSANDDWSTSDGSGLARGASGLAGRTVTVSRSSTLLGVRPSAS